MSTTDYQYFRLWRATGWLIVAAIVVLSLTPNQPHIGDFHMGDKLGHILAYAAGMGWFAALYPATRSRLGYAALFIGLGITLEFLQGLTPYRQFEWLDMLADTAGVALGWWVGQPLLRVLDQQLARVLR